MKAWLVTWDWVSDSAVVADKIAAIYPPRWSDSKASEHVELLYALHTSTVEELAAYAKKPTANPYRAKKDGPFITCGDHPFLVARHVADLKITRDENGLETVSWKEPDRCRVDPDGPPVKVHEGQPQRVKRRISGPLSSKLIWDRSAGRLKHCWGPGEIPFGR